MAGVDGPGNSDRDDELEKRRRDLEATLAARRPEGRTGSGDASTGSAAGFGQALKMSSEFVAGIAVGAALGWFIDWAAGTSPWGLIVFLFLGFGAGVLNVMRSAGLVAEPMQGHRGDKPGKQSPPGSGSSRGS
jgi:ATP synthase protein I